MPDPGGLIIAPARPRVTVGGTRSESLEAALQSLLIAEGVDGLYRCEASFGNWGDTGNAGHYLYFGRDTLDFGDAFAIGLDGSTLFEGRITGIEAGFPQGAPPTITVLAEDRLQDLRMTRRTRTFTDLSDAEVIRHIAADHGLQTEVPHDGPTHPRLFQLNQSDLAFVRDRARAMGAEVWVDGRTLFVRDRWSRGPAVTLTYGGTLHEFSVLADLAHQRTQLRVAGWSDMDKAGFHEEVDRTIIASEAGGGDVGPEILQAAFGERRESVVHTSPANRDHARVDAESRFRAIARRFVVGQGTADTSARLRVGCYATLAGLGPLFSGAYYVSAVRHRFDATRGLRTELTVERVWIGRP